MPKIQIASIGRRYLSYVIDVVILMCITSLVLTPFRISPVPFLFSFLYFQGSEKLFLLSINDLGYTVILFIIFGTCYFFLEQYVPTSLGKLITKQKIVVQKKSTSTLSFRKSIVRAVIKAVIPLNFVDCIFMLKYKRLNQRYTDAHSGLFVIEKQPQFPGKKHRFELIYFLASTILYYLPLVTAILWAYFSTLSQGTENVVDASSSIVVDDMLGHIFSNNFSFNLLLIFGGIILLSLTVLTILSSSLLEGIIIGDVLKNQPFSLLNNVLPHFFFETIAYAFGVATAIIFSVMILDAVEAHAKGKLFVKNSELFKNLRFSLIYLVFSVVLILIGSVIESFLFN